MFCIPLVDWHSIQPDSSCLPPLEVTHQKSKQLMHRSTAKIANQLMDSLELAWQHFAEGRILVHVLEQEAWSVLCIVLHLVLSRSFWPSSCLVIPLQNSAVMCPSIKKQWLLLCTCHFANPRWKDDHKNNKPHSLYCMCALNNPQCSLSHLQYAYSDGNLKKGSRWVQSRRQIADLS